MNTLHADRTQEAEQPLALSLGDPLHLPSPAGAFQQAPGSSWVWLPLLAGFLILPGIAIVDLMSRIGDSSASVLSSQDAPFDDGALCRPVSAQCERFHVQAR